MGNSGRNLLYLCADRGIPIGGSKGSSVHIREFLKAIRGYDYLPTVLACRSEEKSNSPPDYNIHILPDEATSAFLNGAATFGLNKRILREARDFIRNQSVENALGELHEENPIDLIYERYSLFSVGGCTFAQERKIPYVLEVNAPLVYEASRYRELLLDDLAREVEKFLFSAADCVITVSDELGRYVKSIAPDTRIEVVPNGVNIDDFSKPQEKASWRSRMTANPETDFLVTFVGSVKPWHGVDLLIEALQLVITQGQQISLAIVGNGDTTHSELKQSCHERGLDDCVKFTGPVRYEDIPAVMSASDLLVAPYPDLSKFYFSPLKIFEYMAAGKPIVASGIGQIKDLIVDGVTGLLVAPGNPKELAQALQRLKQDRALAGRLGRAAAAVAASNHTWKQRVGRIDRIFQQLTTGFSKADKAGYAGTV